MVFTSSDGVELYYEVHGDSGEPLVLIHGFTGDITDWRHQFSTFSVSHRLLIIDNRGHGRSGAPRDPAGFTIERMADDAEELAAHVGFERYHLLGHSLGGVIAQEIALRSPQRLLSLVLEDTSYSFRNHQPALSDRPSPLSAERQAEVAARFGRMSPDTLHACWAALIQWQGTEERAHQIKVPTLIIFGEHDSTSIISGSRRLAELIPNSEIARIDGAVHCPQEEQPEFFNRVLREFLHRVRPAERDR